MTETVKLAPPTSPASSFPRMAPLARRAHSRPISSIESRSTWRTTGACRSPVCERDVDVAVAVDLFPREHRDELRERRQRAAKPPQQDSEQRGRAAVRELGRDHPLGSTQVEPIREGGENAALPSRAQVARDATLARRGVADEGEPRARGLRAMFG